MDQLTWPDTGEHFEQFWNERTQGFDTVIHRNEHDNGDGQVGRTLLVFQIFVSGNQNVAPPGGLAKKLTILESSPAALLHSAYIVPCELLPQLSWQGFVKQYAHRS
jgi:hypothetical protein